ncbi:MAG: dTDP-4-dehydrorhamnose reductase [Pseudomonadota bacterium]
MSQLSFTGPILLIGASGLLGSEIAAVLPEHLQFPDLDITHSSSVSDIIQRTKPQWIINAAAYTDVDKAETEREKAKLINAIGPAYLAQSAALVGARLIHFSTDYVFSGEGDKPWSENDPKNPVQPNWYGETKLMGESAVLNYPNHLVLRVQWLYGHQRNRFASLKHRDSFSPFVDQFGAPTWTRDVVRALLLLMTQKATGDFHFAYDDFASWMEVYQFVKNELKLPIKLKPTISSESTLPARRPQNGRLSNEKLKKQLGVQYLGSWKTSLREFLQQEKND